MSETQTGCEFMYLDTNSGTGCKARNYTQGDPTMVFEDKDLTCRDCNQTFLFSKGEQEFFSKKGLVNEPKRCPNCRILMRALRNGDDPNKTTEVKCAECDAPTRVPFQPKGYRPVYCSYCFRSKKMEQEKEEKENKSNSSKPDVSIASAS